MNNDQTPYLLALHRGLTLSNARFLSLKSFFKNDFKSAFNANIKDWQAADIDTRGITKFFTNKPKLEPQKEYELLKKCGAHILLKGAKGYPIQLEKIHNPPAILFVRGEILETDFPSISVVGSRKISRYGKRALQKIVSEIAQQNVTIISGLAFGVDGMAHQVALDSGTRTIAVLGNGIDTIYPTQHQNLADRIINEGNGAIISEYLPGTDLVPAHFPVRNRIVAGLSKGTLLIEAALKSGTLITADLANQMGREVFAVPGEIFSKTSQGTNKIIADGAAHIALSGTQILETLNFNHHQITQQNKKDLPLSDIDREILKTFEDGSKIHIDEIYKLCPLDNSVISSNLLLMEMKGLVHNLGNQIYDSNI